jgi:hypothetical protein
MELPQIQHSVGRNLEMGLVTEEAPAGITLRIGSWNLNVCRMPYFSTKVCDLTEI